MKPLKARHVRTIIGIVAAVALWLETLCASPLTIWLHDTLFSSHEDVAFAMCKAHVSWLRALLGCGALAGASVLLFRRKQRFEPDSPAANRGAWLFLGSSLITVIAIIWNATPAPLDITPQLEGTNAVGSRFDPDGHIAALKTELDAREKGLRVDYMTNFCAPSATSPVTEKDSVLAAASPYRAMLETGSIATAIYLRESDTPLAPNEAARTIIRCAQKRIAIPETSPNALPNQ